MDEIVEYIVSRSKDADEWDKELARLVMDRLMENIKLWQEFDEFTFIEGKRFPDLIHEEKDAWQTEKVK